MFVFRGTNPTAMHKDILDTLLREGESCSPRGKKIKEIRPACIEFENPQERVTFLPTRRINPFFQLAEAFWILSGRSDAKWLAQFNEQIIQFSDDGETFNAPYGERLRSYGANSYRNILINPVDQLTDVYVKLLNDKDTRQAVMVISNPHFDNASYTIENKGRDIACNLVVTFKVRNDQIDMTVFNRSNDLIYGTFGANLCQFSTIQELMCSWLVTSGRKEFSKLKVGTYNQITDSLHVYLEDYGASDLNKLTKYLKSNEDYAGVQFSFKDEPRITTSYEEFEVLIRKYWSRWDKFISADDCIKNNWRQVLDEIEHDVDVTDDYWLMTLQAMVAYRLLKVSRDFNAVFTILNEIQFSSWKINMLHFLKKFVQKEDNQEVSKLYNEAVSDVLEQSSKLLTFEPKHQSMDELKKYLDLQEET